MSIRVVDIPSVDKLSQLVAIARENGLAVSIDFLGTSAKHAIPTETWIVQVFDDKERLVISGRGRCLNSAIKLAYSNYFAKTEPRT